MSQFKKKRKAAHAIFWTCLLLDRLKNQPIILLFVFVKHKSKLQTICRCEWKEINKRTYLCKTFLLLKRLHQINVLMGKIICRGQPNILQRTKRITQKFCILSLHYLILFVYMFVCVYGGVLIGLESAQYESIELTCSVEGIWVCEPGFQDYAILRQR